MTFWEKWTWLAGPSTLSDGFYLRMQGVEIDIEDLEDAARAGLRTLTYGTDQEIEDPDVSYSVGHARPVSHSELSDLSIADRNQLQVRASGTVGEHKIGFKFDVAQSTWSVDGWMDGLVHGAMGAGAVSLLTIGQRRFKRRLLRALTPSLISIVVACLVVWVVIDRSIPTPALLLLVLTGAWVIIDQARRAQAILTSSRDQFLPTIVRAESRRETHARRADNRRDARVASRSILGTLGVTAVGWLILWLLTGSPVGNG